MEEQSLTHHEDTISAAGDVVVGGVCVGRRQPRHGSRQRGGRPAARLVREVLTDPRSGCARRGLSGECETCALHSLVARAPFLTSSFWFISGLDWRECSGSDCVCPVVSVI